MKFTRGRRLALTCSALALLMVAGTQQASAQTLLEFLFGDRSSRTSAHEQYQPGQAPSQQQTQRTRQRTQPASVPRISGPSYFDYRTNDLVRMDFAALADAIDEIDAPAMLLDSQVFGTTSDDSDDTSALAEGEIWSAESDSSDNRPASERHAAAFAEMAMAMIVAGDNGAGPQLAVNGRNGTSEAAEAHERLTAQDLDALVDFELRAEAKAVQALVEHYAQSPQFLWVTEGKINDRAHAALDTLADAASHGLNAEDYLVRTPRRGDDEGAFARFEMELSARLLRYVRDAHNGRVDPNRISGYHDFEAKPLDMAGVLAEIADESDVAGLLDGYHPQNDYYRSLRAELETLRAADIDEQIVLASDTIIRPGSDNPEFAKFLTVLKQTSTDKFLAEHGELIAEHAGAQTYSQELVPVIRAAQQAAGVGVDGVIGPRTIHAIIGESPSARIDRVKVAMEQIRWLPSQFGERYVFLNAPGFTASYHEDGEEKLSMRAIYGNTRTQTYFFQDKIDFVEFNPYWGVPRSIIVNTYLPRLLQDPGYFDRAGFEVTTQGGQRIASASVDWGRYGANIPYNVRQTPGPRNAMGDLKIMFPNRHSIYMHDTPDRHLFDRDNRALSNGCIRLQDPRAMAAAVLGWDRERIDERIDGRHSRADLDQKVPVYVAYFTAWPNASGEVEYHPDVYDRDRRILDAIEKIDDLRGPSA